MAWLQSHQSLRDHPKTRKLARRVGDVPRAIGLLHCLWWWAMDYAPDGDLTKHDAEDIAIGCEWDGDPDDIIQALIECGFIDNGDGLSIHDWWEYAGSLIVKREANRERARANYEKRKDSLRADYAQTTGPERKKERKKEREHAGAREPVGKGPRARVSEPAKFPFREAADALRRSS